MDVRLIFMIIVKATIARLNIDVYGAITKKDRSFMPNTVTFHYF